jgi:hypothetical protein
MNQHEFSCDKEMMDTSVEVLRRREAELGAPRDDGPTADELERLVRDLDRFINNGDKELETKWLVGLHHQLVTVPNRWRFPECDPVAQLTVPYLMEMEARLRQSLSEIFPQMAESLQKLASAAIVVRAAERIVMERKDRSDRRRAFLRKLFRLG